MYRNILYKSIESESLKYPRLLCSNRNTMTYYKQEYEVNGKDVVIQQTRGPESSYGPTEPSAWIDGYAAYALESVNALPFDMSDKSEIDKVEAAVAFAVVNNIRFCSKCQSFEPDDTFVQTQFAGSKCGRCAAEDAICQDNDSHDWVCKNASQRHNARVATRYKCQNCGKVKSSTPTG